MSDRELLELAAKAIGGTFDHGADCITMDGIEYQQWDPSEDDGDAMGLAVKLGMTVDFDYVEAGLKNCVAVYLKGGERRYPEHYCGTFPDRAKNARYAILSAAARVGKEMR